MQGLFFFLNQTILYFSGLYHNIILPCQKKWKCTSLWSQEFMQISHYLWLMTWAGLCCRLGGYVNLAFSSKATKLVNSKHNLTTEMNKSGPLSGNNVTQFYDAAPGNTDWHLLSSKALSMNRNTAHSKCYTTLVMSDPQNAPYVAFFFFFF